MNSNNRPLLRLINVGLFVLFVTASPVVNADDGSGMQENSQTSSANNSANSGTDPSASFMAQPASQPPQNQAVVLQAQPVPQVPQNAAPAYNPPPQASTPPPARKKTPGPMNYLVGMFKSLFGQ